MTLVSNYYNKQSLLARGLNTENGGNGVIITTDNWVAGGASQFAPWSAAVNGDLGTGPTFSITPFVDLGGSGSTRVVWQFDEAFACDGLLFIGGNTGSSFGTWDVEGSNDGSTWTTMGGAGVLNPWQPVANGIPANSIFPGMPDQDGQEITWTNTTPFLYWSIVCVISPGAITKTFCNEVLFRSLHNDLDGGNRTSSPLITVTTNMTDNTGNPANTIVDGDIRPYHSSAADNTYLSLTASTSYLQFQFPRAVLMRDSIWLQLQNGGAGVWGTWQWQRSNDGSTWTDEGSPFVFQDVTNVYPSRIIPSPGGTTAATYWRMLCTDGTRSGGTTIFFEVLFNLTEPPTSFMAVVENPDIFAAGGYVGAFGTVGDLLVTEHPDMFAAVGYVAAVGTYSTLEAKDIFSAFGFQPLTGVLNATEAPDRFHATGLGIGEDGVWHTTESVDIFAATGYTPNSGTWSSTENADQFRAIGSGVTVTKKRRDFFVT